MGQTKQLEKIYMSVRQIEQKLDQILYALVRNIENERDQRKEPV